MNDDTDSKPIIKDASMDTNSKSLTEAGAVNAWLEKSRQMWSRIQTVSAIEAGTLVGWYSLWRAHDTRLAIGLVVLAFVLLVVMALLMHRDGQYMYALQQNCGKSFPKVAEPLFNLSGRAIATWLPVILGIGNFGLVVFHYENSKGDPFGAIPHNAQFRVQFADGQEQMILGLHEAIYIDGDAWMRAQIPGPAGQATVVTINPRQIRLMSGF